MERIAIKPKIKRKRYLEGLWIDEYPNLLHLFFELFDTYKSGRKDLEDIQRLLDLISYNNLKDIPEEEVVKIKSLIINNLGNWKLQDDTERVAFLLMSAVLTKDILVFIDDNIIEDTEQPITLNEKSIISFINNQKISNITFTIL